METEQILEEVQLLQSGKDDPCISIIVPTHRRVPERKSDNILIKKNVEKVKHQLIEKYGKREMQDMIQSLDELYEQTIEEHNKDGIGMYLSPKMKLLKQFAFPVTEKVVLSNSFEIRDLLLETQYAMPYFVLLITEKVAKLFQGEMDKLTEVSNDNFPRKHVDDYEYNKPSPASSYSGGALEKGFEKDKSILEEIRVQRFIHEVDKSLDHYLKGNTPLVVCAEVKELGYFSKLSRHKKNIAAEVEGSFAALNEKELADHTWPAFRGFLEKYEDKEIEEFRALGLGRAAVGLEDIWMAVAEGRGLKLLVERDFQSPGYVDINDYFFYEVSPPVPHKKLEDAIDDLIEKTIETKGKVIFVQNGKLEPEGRIALVTRY